MSKWVYQIVSPLLQSETYDRLRNLVDNLPCVGIDANASSVYTVKIKQDNRAAGLLTVKFTSKNSPGIFGKTVSIIVHNDEILIVSGDGVSFPINSIINELVFSGIEYKAIGNIPLSAGEPFIVYAECIEDGKFTYTTRHASGSSIGWGHGFRTGSMNGYSRTHKAQGAFQTWRIYLSNGRRYEQQVRIGSKKFYELTAKQNI